MVYFSDLQKRPITDKQGQLVGLLKDLVFIDGEEFAEVTHLIYISEEGYRKKIPWKHVEELKEPRVKGTPKIDIILGVEKQNLNPTFERGDEFLIGNIVDKQLVDVNGVKVVRVNDILLGKIGDKFCIVAACVGLRSMLRRLGFNRLIKLFPKLAPEYIVKWEDVEPLEKNLHDIHVKIQKNRIADLHPEDIADIMEDLDTKERALIFKTLDQRKRIRTLIDVEPHVRKTFFNSLQIKSIVEILENIPASNAADLLSAMSRPKVEKILGLINKEQSQKVREILHYPQESAAAIMHTNLIAVPKNFTAQQTITLMRKIKPHERTYHIYVTNPANKLLGILSIRALIISSPSKKVSQLMKTEVVKVRLNTPKDEIARAMARYDLFVLPVVDDKNTLKGVVNADDVISEILPEANLKSTIRPLLLKIKNGNNKTSKES